MANQRIVNNKYFKDYISNINEINGIINIFNLEMILNKNLITSKFLLIENNLICSMKISFNIFNPYKIRNKDIEVNNIELKNKIITTNKTNTNLLLKKLNKKNIMKQILEEIKKPKYKNLRDFIKSLNQNQSFC
jgi:hypothetical protein